MDEMIVRVAKALCGEGSWEAYTADARAAILAMREPTEAMIAAAADTPGMQAVNSVMQLHQARGYGFADGAFDGGSPLEQAWKAMIDVASNTIPIVDMATIDRAD